MSAITLSILLILMCICPVGGNDRIVSVPRKQREHIKYVIIMSFLSFLVAFRANTIGNDTGNYLDLFNTIKFLEIKDLHIYSDRFEMGYIWLNKLLSYISYNPQIILITSAVFAYYFYGKFIMRYSPMIGLSILIFFFARFHDSNMNIVRQVLATGFTLWAYLSLKQNKNILFFILIFLAFSMHKSAIVFLAAWPITKIQFKKSYIKYFVVLCILFFILGRVILGLIMNSGLVQSYYEDSEYLEGGKIAPVILLLMDIFIFLFYINTGGYKQNFVKNNISSDIAWMLMCSILCSIIGLYFAMMVRVAWYFKLFQLIAIPYAVSRYTPKSRIVILFFVVLLFFIYYIVINTVRPTWNMVYPYKLCFLS